MQEGLDLHVERAGVTVVRLPYGETLIAPIGDIQYNGRGGQADVEALGEWVERAASMGAYFIFMGDVVDTFAPTDRRGVRRATIDMRDPSRLVQDELFSRLEEEIFSVLEPARGRTLAVLEGHHFLEHFDGTTTDQRLAERLGAPFVGRAGWLVLDWPHTHYARKAVIYAVHPDGSAATMGGIMQAIERRMGGYVADVFLIAHFHQLVAWRRQRLSVRVGRGRAEVTEDVSHIVLTGSWMRAAPQQAGGRIISHYAQARWLNPVPLGAPLIVFHPKLRGGRDVLEIRVTL